MNERRFLQRVAEILQCDERRADAITFAVFQELRDRLTPDEADDVSAQLPTGLARLWNEGDDPDRLVSGVHRAEFVGRVRRRAALQDEAEAERGVLAVFQTLQILLGSRSGLEGESWDILSQLPKDLKKLWLSAADQTPLEAKEVGG